MAKRLIAVLLIVCMTITIGPAFAYTAKTQDSSGKLASATTYADVSPNHWATTIIKTLSEKGVINGYADGAFKPDGKVTRAEFTKMLMVYMKIASENTPTGSFTDVPQDYWAHDFIEGAKAISLVDGYADKTFKPNNNITRAEIAQIMTAAQAKVQKLAKYKASSSDYAFPDIATNWARNSITTMSNLHIISGYPDGKFRPDRTATRAEAAKMLYLLASAVLGEQITNPGLPLTIPGGGSYMPPQQQTEQPCVSEIEKPNKGEHTFDVDGGSFYIKGFDDDGIDGTTIDVPEFAVDPGQNVKVAVNNIKSLEAAGLGAIDTHDARTIKASDVISISKDTCCNFKLPISVTIPFVIYDGSSGDIPSVFYWDSNAKKYVAVGVEDVETYYDYTGTNESVEGNEVSTGPIGHGTITFKTVHSGKYVALAIRDLSSSFYGSGPDTVSVDTGFRPNTDAFYRPAFGTIGNRDKAKFAVPNGDIWWQDSGGTSIGMANYAAWYYANKAKSQGGLAGKYKDGNPDDISDDARARELISRAYLASSNMWTWLLNSFVQGENNYSLSDNDTAYLLVQAMLITGDPQILVANGISPNSEVSSKTYGYAEDARALVVYAYDQLNQELSVYDPTIANENTTTHLERQVLGLGEGFYYSNDYNNTLNEYMFEGISSSLNPSQFETLLAGVEGSPSWDPDKFGTIHITSPQIDEEDNEAFIGSDELTITGTVSGGSKKAKYIICNIQGLAWADQEAVPVNEDGSFEIPVDLDNIGGWYFSIMLYASDSECATLRRCAQPYSAFKEFFINND